jgi:hypothetical protein
MNTDMALQRLDRQLLPTRDPVARLRLVSTSPDYDVGCDQNGWYRCAGQIVSATYEALRGDRGRHRGDAAWCGRPPLEHRRQRRSA